MGCAVQFHIKPGRRKTFGEHLEDGFYLKTSEEHYRTHVIFAKKTRAKRLTDTVFFKHKYITQPTITPADAIVNAYNKLWQAIQGLQHSKDDAHFEALERIENIMQPTSKHAIKPAENVKLPRVEQVKLTQHVPRVSFDTTPPADSDPPARLIVESPTKQSIPILKPPKFVDESIAARVRARRLQMPTANPVPNESIADRVAHRRREAAHSVLDHKTGQLLEYRQLLKNPKFKEIWTRSAADEFGRLAQGIGGKIKGTDTILFIHKREIPTDILKDVTYIKFVCNVRTKKKDPNRTRATMGMGGNLINYPEDVGTPTANLLLIKIFLNSVISTRGAKFAGADLANFYLMTPLKRPEYANIKLSDIPEEVIKEKNLHQYATPDGWVYIKVSRGMYGLPQAGSLGHDLLEQ
jgi:hypothetical protein